MQVHLIRTTIDSFIIMSLVFFSTATFATRININHDVVRERAFCRHDTMLLFFHIGPIQFP